MFKSEILEQVLRMWLLLMLGTAPVTCAVQSLMWVENNVFNE